MFNRISRRLRIMSDRLLIRTEPMRSMNQIHWGMELASDVYAKGHQQNPQSGYKKNCGLILWNTLPPDMATIVIRRSFDPYNKEMDKGNIRNWLWDHVLFDNEGMVIAIHDRGEILFCREGWEKEVDWYSRVKMNQDKYWLLKENYV